MRVYFDDRWHRHRFSSNFPRLTQQTWAIDIREFDQKEEAGMCSCHGHCCCPLINTTHSSSSQQVSNINM
ncbi:hypothetical protein JOB18_014812 [Solea senegalensis]|uniref:Uncharacterized protein n=1 Tax=Solea senegalensis TaxID=28829 RepID=A0AAV6Q809_SOLSE|nr:hypothetical protein JOB18_014812 [Solea senegalensis]